MKNILKRYSIKEIKNDIQKYGFNYHTKDFLIEAFVLMAIVIFIAYISHLKFQYILVLLLLTILLIPTLISSWFKQNYNIKRFSLLTEYLTNIIPIFVQKTKIRFCLGELFDITSGHMKETIKRAIDYIDNTVDDPDLHKNALKIIEEEYPNSRVISAHKILLSIESANSLSYEGVCANMYEDIEKWVKRVYTFQKDLKNRRGKLLILCVAALFMNSILVYLYSTSSFLSDFVYEPVYQISTLIFIASVLITITVVLTKLHGEWLINDTEYLDDEYLKKKYQRYKKGKPVIKAINIIIFIWILLTGAYFFYLKKALFGTVICLYAFIILFNPFIKYKSTSKYLSKALTIEFPVWLREISLNLNNYTVLNAIEYSQNMASYPLRKEIRKFLNEAKKDPTSVKPYNNFLNEFDLEDAKASMKVLYAIGNIGKEDVSKRISNLIVRNQEMLDKAETIRNEDSIGGIESIGYVPIVLLTGQMLVTMFSMFSFIMANISQAINI